MRILIGLLLLIYGISSFAENHQSKETLVDFQASVEQKIENDVMVARLQIVSRDADISNVRRLINRDMQWALQQVKAYQQIEFQTQQYSIYPVYEAQQIQAWSGQQTLRLQATDFVALTELLGVLQAKLNIIGIDFSVSNARLTETENALLSQAVDAFEAKAALISKAMGRDNYYIAKMSVTNNQAFQRQPTLRAQSGSFAEMQTAPVVAAGTQTLRITLSGQVILMP